jgi:SAM-dependent methyltransferase
MPDEIKYVHESDVHRSKDAGHIVPYLMKLFHPRSVLDVGCGLGNFLQAFIGEGVKDVYGVEGPWLDKTKLVIDSDLVIIRDLENVFSLERRYDMVLCLEVAEHLSENSAATLVDVLTAHGDVIVFSAAVPGQGGQNHINEQWIGYWERLFNDRGYKLYDIIRPYIWNINDIFWWYRQNIVVAIKSSREVSFKTTPVNDYIHPELYLSKIAEIDTLKEMLASVTNTDKD